MARDPPARARAAIAAAILSSCGTSYQRCGFASAPWTPRTSAIVTTMRLVARARVLEPRHEGVVAEAVLDHDLRLRDGEAVDVPGLEEVGVGVRVREDRRDRDVRAADLLRDVAVDVLRRDDVERPAARRGACRSRRASRHAMHDNENGSHSHNAASIVDVTDAPQDSRGAARAARRPRDAAAARGARGARARARRRDGAGALEPAARAATRTPASRPSTARSRSSARRASSTSSPTTAASSATGSAAKRTITTSSASAATASSRWRSATSTAG